MKRLFEMMITLALASTLAWADGEGTKAGDRIAERVEAQETKSSDQEKVQKEIAKAARDAGKANPDDPDAVKEAVKKKLDEIKDRKSGGGNPGGADNKEIKEWIKKLKADLMDNDYISAPTEDARVLLTGVVTGGESATMTVVDSNGAVLSGVVVDVNGERRLTDSLGRIVVPVVAGSSLLVAKLNGRETVAQVVLPEAAPAIPVVNQAPSHVLPGTTLKLTGAGFSGEAGGNTVKLGGREMSVLASSPRELIAQVPSDLPAQPLPLLVKTSRGESAPRPVTLTRLSIESASTALKTGQTGEATLRLSCPEPQELIVTNASDSIRMVGGRTVVVKTSGGGNNTATIHYTAQRPGAFQIQARIADQ